MLGLTLTALLAVDGGLVLKGDPQNARGIPGLDRRGDGMPVTIPKEKAGPACAVFVIDPEAKGMGADEAARSFARLKPRLRACYQAALQSEPTLSGWLALNVAIDDAGLASKAEVVEGSFKDTEVARCVRQSALAFTFPPGGAGRMVSATLAFELAGKDGQSLPPPESLTLEVGESKVFHLPNVQRIAVSGDVYDLQPVGNGHMMIKGFREGRATALFWVGDGRRYSIALKVIEAGPHAQPSEPVPSVKHRADRSTPGEVEVFEIPEELHDLREVKAADAGFEFEGIAADGTKRILSVTPRR